MQPVLISILCELNSRSSATLKLIIIKLNTTFEPEHAFHYESCESQIIYNCAHLRWFRTTFARYIYDKHNLFCDSFSWFGLKYTSNYHKCNKINTFFEFTLKGVNLPTINTHLR